MQILRAAQDYFKPATTLNGDQTDRGLQLPEEGTVDEVPHAVRITVGRF